MKTVWGVMGAARIADKFCTAVKNNGGRVGYIGSSDEGRAHEFADRHGIARYGDYDGLLADKEVNAVYVCGTNDVHYEHTLRALNAGKNVLVEKPAAVNAEQWRLMTETAKSKKLFLMEAMWTLFLPFARVVKDNLQRIGKLRMLQCDFCTNIPNMSHSGVSRVFALKNFGGGLLDLGIYCVHFCNFVMNGAVPESVSAEGVLNYERTDSLVALALKYGDVLTTVRTAIDCAGPRGAAIYGEAGSITLPTVPAPQEVIIKTSAGEEKIDAQFPGNGFEPQILHAEQCISHGLPESPFIAHATTATAVGVLADAMLRINYGINYSAQ